MLLSLSPSPQQQSRRQWQTPARGMTGGPLKAPLTGFGTSYDWTLLTPLFSSTTESPFWKPQPDFALSHQPQPSSLKRMSSWVWCWGREKGWRRSGTSLPCSFLCIPVSLCMFLSRLPFVFFPSLALAGKGGPGPALVTVVGFWMVAPPRLKSCLRSRSIGVEYREGCAVFHSPARKINTPGPSLGRQRVLLRYYGVKTKQILEPSSASLARKYIFQSGWSQTFI